MYDLPAASMGPERWFYLHSLQEHALAVFSAVDDERMIFDPRVRALSAGHGGKRAQFGGSVCRSCGIGA